MRRACLLAIFLAGCASAQPAPIAYGGGGAARGGRQPVMNERGETGAPRIEYRGGRPVEPARTEEPPPEPQRETPRSAPAQASPNWADGEGTPLSAYALRPEDVQPYDPANLPRTHRVRANESLYDIATMYQAPLRALIDQNNLEPPYTMSAGQELRLPPPRIHTVALGESFEDVAQRYHVDPRSLALLNRMQPPYNVSAGERIVLPAMARAYEAPAPAPVASNMEMSPPPVPRGDGRFQWPLRGELAARYGAQPNGQRIDGVEIAGREGDRIVAAADGDVVYAGDDLPAYGTLILIRHADNYVTAYAHTRRALVAEGARVRAGQPIAELGPRSDGRVRLLFQVRQGSAAVDPLPFLGARE
jgi:murein DD-endopeptidase MepM/ murein hydrolase activator NlpD